MVQDGGTTAGGAMMTVPTEEGLRITTEAEDTAAELPPEDGHVDSLDPDSDLESLRDTFVEGFNARDLEALMAIVREDVDCPDIGGSGAVVLAEELESIWERSPGAILTRGFLDDVPCALGWLPDEEGCWTRAALVCFDSDDGLLSLVALPDDADAVDRAEGEEPAGEEIEEWSDWAEWERGEETLPHERR
jgi:hypothetical protein